MKPLIIIVLWGTIALSPVFGQSEMSKVYGMDDPELEAKPRLENETLIMEWLYENNQLLKPKKDLGKFNKVTVVFTVDKNGSVVDPFVWKGIGRPYDGEAIRLLRSLPYKWIPGLVNGEHVDVVTSYTISFIGNP